MSKHYIAMSGDHGCLPDYCDVFATRQQAQDSLAQLFDDVRGVKRNLSRFGYFDLPEGSGAEYCEIEECSCPSPWEHQDDMTEEQFIKECGPDFGLTDSEE